MNALVNSQVKELDEYLRDGYGEGRESVPYARYTSQESEERRNEIRDHPPDILLTDYVMAQGLEFPVFDELHTYRAAKAPTWPCSSGGGTPSPFLPPIARQ
jgi:ATP-dependent helicase YprA (DUF1998 family)